MVKLIGTECTNIINIENIITTFNINLNEINEINYYSILFVIKFSSINTCH